MSEEFLEEWNEQLMALMMALEGIGDHTYNAREKLEEFLEEFNTIVE